jgi:hypothetical protein
VANAIADKGVEGLLGLGDGPSVGRRHGSVRLTPIA